MEINYRFLGGKIVINEFNGGHDYELWNAEFMKILNQLFSTK